jgi:hypothetical protein
MKQRGCSMANLVRFSVYTSIGPGIVRRLGESSAASYA